jgi:probable HAF family extracellular repeat protein
MPLNPTPAIRAIDINNSGQVAGAAMVDGKWWPCIYNVETGIVQMIGSLGGERDNTVGFAMDINEHGQTVGFAQVDYETIHGFLYSEETGMFDIGEIHAYSINDAGLIVGSGAAGTVLWDEGNILPAIEGNGGVGIINNMNQVAGWNYDLESRYAYLYNYDTGTFTDLGDMADDTYPSAINDAGAFVGNREIVVGTEETWYESCPTGWVQDCWEEDGTVACGEESCPGGIVLDSYFADIYGYIAVLYEEGRLYNLNEIAGAPDEWNLLHASDINNSGQIVGIAGVGEGNLTLKAFLLTPVK